jgi:hypothetical protein
MPKKKNKKFYFGEEQEEAVVRYLMSDSEDEKNRIFNEYLRAPLIIMVESIIRRYKLHRKGFSFEENHTDTISFLITKVEKFDPVLNNRAYSYFGTICKNYLMGAMQKDAKELNKKISYEDISTNIDDNADYSYSIDDVEINYEKIVKNLAELIEEVIKNDDLNENELKLGYALLDIFYNFEKIFQIGDGNKFNKNLILLSLREMTGLSTKEIRLSLKKFRKVYNGILGEILN